MSVIRQVSRLLVVLTAVPIAVLGVALGAWTLRSHYWPLSDFAGDGGFGIWFVVIGILAGRVAAIGIRARLRHVWTPLSTRSLHLLTTLFLLVGGTLPFARLSRASDYLLALAGIVVFVGMAIRRSAQPMPNEE